MSKLFIPATILLLFSACNSLKKADPTSEVQSAQRSFKPLLSKILSDAKHPAHEGHAYADINKLKRLGVLYHGEWLPRYYAALFTIRLSFVTKDPKKRDTLLADALRELEILKDLEKAVRSEVVTLRAFYYYAKIAENPKRNGPLYYGDLMRACQKAMAMDAKNPRPVLLLSLFKKRMSGFTGAAYEGFCSDLNRLKIMFKNFRPRAALDPDWGCELLARHMKNDCSQG